MQDFLINRYGDLDISTGDIAIGFSDYQHQEHILIAQKGSLKEFPGKGVGIENYLKDSEIDEMVSEVRTEYERDGMTVTKVGYSEETKNLDFNANY